MSWNSNQIDYQTGEAIAFIGSGIGLEAAMAFMNVKLANNFGGRIND